MKKILLAAVSFAFIASSCSKKQCAKKCSNTTNDPILMEVGKQVVPVSEFKYFYEKNNRNNNTYTKESLDEYMNLFKKFKLKVAEANHQGLQNNESFIKEFEGYKKDLAKPYLTEDNFNETLAKEAFERSKFDVRSSHILIKVASDASPKDTLEAFGRIKEIQAKIIKGEDFGDLAKEHSDDKSAQMEGAPRGYKGDLGYFTALSLVYNYENALYNTPVGKVSDIFRTQFGYHILKVTDKRDSDGEVKVAQILVRSLEGSTSEDKASKKKKIDDIYKELSNGAKWKTICEKFSEHEQTKLKGGEMQPFTRGGYVGVPEFEDAAFSLENSGDISKPVKTPYGWHIIKLIHNTKDATFDDVKDQFVKKVRSKPRAQLDKVVLTKRLQLQNNFEEIDASKHIAIKSLDENYTKGTWTFNESNKLFDNKLFSLNKDEYKIFDFLAYAKENMKKRSNGTSFEYIAEQTYTNYVQKTVYDYEEAHLEDKHFDYKMLVKEYRDGLLLFDVMKNDVWDKAQKDTSALKEHYKNNTDKYQWKERIDATIYTLRKKETQDELITLIDNKVSTDSIQKIFDAKSPLALRIKDGKYEQNGSSLIKKIDWNKSRNIINEDDAVIVVQTKEKIKPTGKAYKEAKGLIISDYQTVLEEEWLTGLAKKHPIKVNEEIFTKLIKK